MGMRQHQHLSQHRSWVFRALASLAVVAVFAVFANAQATPVSAAKSRPPQKKTVSKKKTGTTVAPLLAGMSLSYRTLPNIVAPQYQKSTGLILDHSTMIQLNNHDGKKDTFSNGVIPDALAKSVLATAKKVTIDGAKDVKKQGCPGGGATSIRVLLDGVLVLDRNETSCGGSADGPTRISEVVDPLFTWLADHKDELTVTTRG
jgi:hypothetical protein